MELCCGDGVHYVGGGSLDHGAGSNILHGRFFSGEKIHADYLATYRFVSFLFFPIFLSFLEAADAQVSEVTTRCSSSVYLLDGSQCCLLFSLKCSGNTAITIVRKRGILTLEALRTEGLLLLTPSHAIAFYKSCTNYYNSLTIIH